MLARGGRVALAEGERRGRAAERRLELSGQAVLDARLGVLEMAMGRRSLPAQGVQLRGARVMHRPRRDGEVHAARLAQPCLGLVPAAEPQQVVDRIDVHEAAERAAHAEPRRRALARVHGLEGPGVVPAEPPQLAEVHVGAHLVLAAAVASASRSCRSPAAVSPRKPSVIPSVVRAAAGCTSPPAAAATASACSQRSRDSAQRRRPISACPSAASRRARTGVGSSPSSRSACP